MIKFERTEVMNLENAIRGMRNPLNSWDKSDSAWEFVEDPSPINPSDEFRYVLGENDLALAQKLIKAGSDHRKFLRQIFVSVDITAPLYWWKEYDTYKVATVANSCSTMHKIHSKPIEISDFSFDDMMIDFTTGDESLEFKFLYEGHIEDCEILRRRYIETKDKKYWRALIQLLPESYNQKRTVTLNYETLRNIYGSRRNHKLDEWSVGFMTWIDSLPYAEELIKYAYNESAVEIHLGRGREIETTPKGSYRPIGRT